MALPGTDDERLSGADPLGDFDWLRNAAERQAHIHQPADETVSQLHEEVEQLQDIRRVEQPNELNLCKAPDVGPAPRIEGKWHHWDYEKGPATACQNPKAIARYNPEHR